MYTFLNIIMSFWVGYIIYHLALTIIGVHFSFKQSLIPTTIYTILIFISKIVLHLSPVFHSLIITIICILLTYLYNKIALPLSLIGSLTSIIIIIFGSNLIVCPLALQFGLEISGKVSNKFDWFLLNVLETIPPLVVFLILKIKKLSFIKLMDNFQG